MKLNRQEGVLESEVNPFLLANSLSPIGLRLRRALQGARQQTVFLSSFVRSFLPVVQPIYIFTCFYGTSYANSVMRFWFQQRTFESADYALSSIAPAPKLTFREVYTFQVHIPPKCVYFLSVYTFQVHIPACFLCRPKHRQLSTQKLHPYTIIRFTLLQGVLRWWARSVRAVRVESAPLSEK